MKKTKTLFVLALSALMLASCGEGASSQSKEDKEDVTSSDTNESSESGEQPSDSEPSPSKELTAEEIWKNAFDNDKMENYTLSYNAGENAFVQKRTPGENGYSYCKISSGDYYYVIYGKKDDSLIEYYDNNDGTWSTQEFSLSELKESSREHVLSMFSYESICPNFGEYFSKFVLSSDGTYVFEGKEGEDEIVTNGLTLMMESYTKTYKAIVSFEDNHLKSVTYWKSDSVLPNSSVAIEFTDWGTTTIDIPTNLHTHTFEKEWSSDEHFHYHKGTCGHNVSADYAEHTYKDGVCTVCGYSYSSTEKQKIVFETSRERKPTILGMRYCFRGLFVYFVDESVLDLVVDVLMDEQLIAAFGAFHVELFDVVFFILLYQKEYLQTAIGYRPR